MMERRLAAIFSTDVKGYSRLMGEDEEATIRTLTAYREAMTTLIQRHGGRVVDSPGDNLLAEFPSVVEAVQCAVAIQQEIRARNAALLPHRRIEFRIGINLGDVIVDGERIYGDGVNIAARLEGLAEAGGICLSGTVYDQIKTKLAFAYTDLGAQAVKNIAEPVRVYRVQMEPGAAAPPKGTPQGSGVPRWLRGAVVLVGLLLLGGGVTLWQRSFRPLSPADMVPSMQAPSLPLPDKPSIAVLPFINMSGDPEQEYFSDGITEDLMTDLSRLAGLFVIARNSVFTYKGRAVKPDQISRELGVRYVIEGSVRKANNRVRITAQLVDASRGYHLWAERYDRDLKDIFVLQDEIAQKIVTALQLKLEEGERDHMRRKNTENLDAWDHFIRAGELFRRATKEANMQAREMLEKAISLDPKFSRAYAKLAATHRRDWLWGWAADPKTSEQQALELAQRAVALDDSSPDGHKELAMIYVYKRQHEQAIAEAKRAVALDQNDAHNHAVLAEVLNYAGQPKEAIELVEKAMRLDPRYPAHYLYILGQAYNLTGQYEDAIGALRRSIVRNPDFLPAHAYLAAVYIEVGLEEEARAEMTEVRRIGPQSPGSGAGQRGTPYKNPAVSERLLAAWRKAEGRK